MLLESQDTDSYIDLDVKEEGLTRRPFMKKLLIGLGIFALVSVITIGIVMIPKTNVQKTLFSSHSQANGPRTYIPLDIWNFTKDIKDVDYSEMLPGAENITIPHTWNNFDGQDGGDDYVRCMSLYQKSIFIGDELNTKKLFIEFFGAHAITNVYLNGVFIGEHVGGFATFRFEITDNVLFGEDNLLSVTVSNKPSTDYYPHEADFTFFGGIYRKANIVAVSQTHFEMMDYGSSGLYITPFVEKTTGMLSIRTVVVFEEEGIDYQMRYTVVDNNNKTIIRELHQNDGTGAVFTIDKPHLWNGRADPFLYTAYVEVFIGSEVSDIISHDFGFRTMAISREGFFLNDEKVRLNGVNRHQDRQDKGWAVSSEDEIEDFDLIYEMGANAIRLAHYQQNESVFEICNRKGFIVWVEVPFIQRFMNTRKSTDNIMNQYIELIKQNFNHPCIAMWGTMNELAFDGHESEELTAVSNMSLIAHVLDPTRLTTGAITPNFKSTDELPNIPDVNGWNFYYGWYYGEISDVSSVIDNLLKEVSFHPMSISEYGADANIKYHSENPKAKDYSEEYQTLLHMKTYEIFLTKKIWGTFIWNMFEFAVDSRDEGGVKGRNNKGMVTYDRKIKKDAYYYYIAMWSEDPFVYVSGKRFHDRAVDNIKFYVFSNQKDLKVYLNDEIIATETNFTNYKEYSVTLNKGVNIVKTISGDLEDSSEFERVTKENPSYRCPN